LSERSRSTLIGHRRIDEGRADRVDGHRCLANSAARLRISRSAMLRCRIGRGIGRAVEAGDRRDTTPAGCPPRRASRAGQLGAVERGAQDGSVDPVPRVTRLAAKRRADADAGPLTINMAIGPLRSPEPHRRRGRLRHVGDVAGDCLARQHRGGSSGAVPSACRAPRFSRRTAWRGWAAAPIPVPPTR
jgi:hypothetical protein